MSSDKFDHHVLRLRSHYSTFSRDTTFHGFLELHKSKRWYQKCLWIMIMLGCTAMLCYQIHEQMRQYLDCELVTKTTRMEESDSYAFPKPILVLPTPTWIDVSKVAEFGFTYEDIQIAKGYLRPTFKNRTLQYESQISVDDAKESLASKMNSLGSKGIYHLFTGIAWRKFHNFRGTDMVDALTISRDLAAYTLNIIDAQKLDTSKTWRSEFVFNFTAYWENGNMSSKFFKNSDKKNGIAPNLFNPDTGQRISLFPNYVYQISVGCSLYRRFHACANTTLSSYYPALCKADCQYQADLIMYNCFQPQESDGVMFDLSESFRNGSIPLCHSGMSINETLYAADIREVRNLTNAEEGQRARKVKDCHRRCMPKCDSYSSSWNVLSSPYSDESDEGPLAKDAARIVLNYPDAETMVITEEVERYKWHDVVSNIGGLLGLWLGASIMSIFQAVHLCCWEEN